MDLQSPSLDGLPALAAVSDDRPAGPDLRQDYTPQSLYYRLRDARSEARAAERQADAGDDKAEAAALELWRTVRDLAAGALEATRDLEIGAWNVEALLRCEGLPGFTRGTALLIAMAEQFWDDLHPLPDEEGLEARVAPLAGLNGQGNDGTLIQPLRKLVVFRRPDGDPVAFWQYDQSVELAGIANAARREQRIEAGVLPFETVEAEARAAGGQHFAGLRREVAAASDAWQRLSDALTARAGVDAPPTSQVRDVLARLQAIATRYAAPEPGGGQAERSADHAAADPGRPEAEMAAGVAQAGVGRVSPGRLEDREDALRALEAIAAFFQRIEPHSPLSYTLQEAVRRGRMAWPQLLAEVVPDASTRAMILTSLGIKPPEGE